MKFLSELTKKINGMQNKSAEVEAIKESFPSNLHDEIDALFAKAKIKANHSTAPGIALKSRTEFITIPYRIYYEPIEGINSSKYSDKERLILYSIFSRHSNGYIRQLALKNIVNSDYYWTIPFLTALMGDYVYEIINDINNDFAGIHKENLTLFIEQNPEYFAKTRSRIISYWNCYYRLKFPAKIKGVKVPLEQSYPGIQLIDKIKIAIKQGK